MHITIFFLSGLGIALLLLAKRIEEKRKVKPLILEIISRGDARMREKYHNTIIQYSISKERFQFFVKKQLPMRSRSTVNKLIGFFRGLSNSHFHNLRDSRLLKKSDGISDFFKNISSVEKGGGEIYEEIYKEELDALEAEELTQAYKPDLTPTPQPVELVKFEIVEPKTTKPRIKRVQKHAKTSGRKLKITEVVGEQ